VTDAPSPLQRPFVRAFMAGRFFAVLGSQVASTTAGWQIYERTNDPWHLGLVGLVELLPVLALILPAGSLADRRPRRHLAVLAHGAIALTFAGLALLSAADGPVSAVFALLAATGAARAIATPSVATMMPQLLTPPEFARANAWLSSSVQLAIVGGPALAGLLIALGGPVMAYATAAVGQLAFCALLLAFVPVAPPSAVLQTRRSARDLFAGLRFIRHHRIFLAAITLDLFAVLLGGAVALLPVYARDILHVGPVGLGWLRAAPGIGAALMAILLARLPPWRRPGVALLFAVAGFGVATIGFGLSRDFTLSFVCLFLTGFLDEISVLVRATLEQMITPDHLRGRVASVNHIFIGFSNQLGAFESGSVAALIGATGSVVVGGVGAILVVLATLRVFPELVRLPPLDTLSPLPVPDEDSPANPGRHAGG
jgi:MFS family permease